MWHINFLHVRVKPPMGAVSIAFDEDGSIYAFFDVPVISYLESECTDGVVAVGEGYWATTLVDPDSEPAYLGQMDLTSCPVSWVDSLVIIDEEARENYNDELFENAKEVFEVKLIGE